LRRICYSVAMSFDGSIAGPNDEAAQTQGGGGGLFRSLLDLGLVDTVEVAVIPVLLGGGVPLVAAAGDPTKLKLTGQKVFAKTGTVTLEYASR